MEVFVWTSVKCCFYFTPLCHRLLLFVGFTGSIDPAAIVDFVDSGHDLIIAVDNSASEQIRAIATECGVDFDDVSIRTLCLFHFENLSGGTRIFIWGVPKPKS